MGPFPTCDIARKHRYRYHSVPIPFLIGGNEYVVGQSDGHYSCPLPECKFISKKREAIQKHINVAHNASVKIKVFDAPECLVASKQVLDQDSGVRDGTGNLICPEDVWSDDLVPEGPSREDVCSRDPSFDMDSSTVSLSPSVDYLMSNEVLDSLGVCFHSHLRFLICYSCKVALTSGMVSGHRKKHHHAYQVPSSTMESFLDYCSRSNVHEKPEHVKLPTAGGPPVQMIASPVEGFSCTASADCVYAVKDLGTIQRHSREKHSVTGLQEIQYRSCLVQHIFTAVGNSYFEVGQNVIPSARPNLKSTLKATFLPAVELSLVVPANTERERTPLIRFMGWDRFEVELRMNPARRRAAEQIKKKHSDDEFGGILTRLAAAVQDHMARASTILDGHPHRLSLSKILLYGDAIPRETDNHWRPVSDENVEYPGFIVQFMRAIMRVHLGFPLDFSFELSAAQTLCLEELVTVLGDENASPRKRMIFYHNLAWSLVDTDPDLCVGQRWANPIKRAIWLRALRADGNFCEASVLTPDLAKFKYLCNVTSLLEALMDKDEDTDSVHSDDHDRVARVHDRVLRLGRPTTFNIIYEMQQYASSLVFSQTREPNVYVDPDVKSITIGVHTMHMDKLRDGIQRLLQVSKSRYSALTNDIFMLKMVPEQVKDDLTNSTRGYSLVSEDPFFKNRHAMFFYLVDHYDLAMVDNAGRIAWNIPGIKDLLRRSSCVWEPIYHLLYITTHISCRGTQFVDHKISNSDRHRNLFMQGMEMFLLTAYSKRTGITDRDSCTPGFVPKDIAFLVLEMIAGGLRTAEAILAGVAYGAEAEHLYRTYLCVGEGVRTSPTRFSANIQQWNHDYFDCRWGVRDFRQGAITIGREFIAPDDSYDQADNILAESADHSTGVDHTHYGIVQGVVPRLSNNSMCKHRWLGDQWHSVLGLGPLAPPEAIRIRHKNMSNGTTLQAIADVVKKTTQETIKEFLDAHRTDVLKDTISTAIIKQLKDATDDAPEISSPLPTTWNGGSFHLSSNLDAMFYEESEGIRRDPASSSGPSGYNNNSVNASPVVVSPTASGYIQCGEMLSDSPLPVSSITSISQTEYIEGSTTFSDVVPTTHQSEFPPFKDRKGKGRAYETPEPPLVDGVMSSSISPIADIKGKRKRGDYENIHSRAFANPARASRRKHAPRSVSHHNSIPSTSGSYPVTPTAHRARKYAPRVKLSLERVAESTKHVRRLSSEVMDISSDEELSSLDTIQLKRLRGSRTSVPQVPVEVISLSSSGEDSSPDENMPIKRLRKTAASVQQMPIDAASLFSGECSPSKRAVTSFGTPASPPSAVQDVQENIRRAIRHIRKDDSATEKTPDQMDMLMAVMSAHTDLVITMRTGGGKSMSWMIPSVMDENSRSIVVCPFVALLDQQFMATASTGLRCHNYCVSKVVPENAQIFFLVSPLGRKFNRVFVDEFHDIMNCHPGRVVPWKNLAQQFGKTLIRIVLMTGTGPPHRIANFIKPFGLHLGIVTQVRSDTNRPEIGMHVIQIQPIAAMQSLGHLVSALCKLLAEEEHILVFCGSQGDAQAFAVKANCAVYHSDLWEAGNSRASNLSRWDSGDTKVMACTTAFAQGMDRPHVRYVVIFKPSYGLLVNNQMLGRAGRDGKESHVFFLTDRRAKTYRGPPTDQCIGELDDLVHGTECRRFANMTCMDGHNLAVRCTDYPPGIHCDVCDPNSVMQRLSIQAIANPFRPPEASEHAVTPVFASGSMLQAPTHAPPPLSTGFVPVSSLLSMNMISHTITPQPSQSSDALYDAGALELTSFQALMLDSMEEIHGKGNGESSDKSYTTKSQPSLGRAVHIETPSTSSLPSVSRTFVSRASAVNTSLHNRLSSTARLDKYMKVLKDKCPSHFGNGGCLVPAANHRNGEEPACHAGFSYRKGEKCPFAGFIFRRYFACGTTQDFDS
ncbi:uncharacterized protein HD556DRAFT_1314192 [Suillus plorans]|uniref:DNA 3'-5' helicase n=1 Tax=Suillus plorans TaxID=116603 RepID=A0A9P7DAZ7_9AGAM|nr:uncharacterized protein HD556DRAFT_1314192 [Suillus plorans]KAG1785568.1 hypothetical protein HD556DRAFT_1314192 [Suillus plorans]